MGWVIPVSQVLGYWGNLGKLDQNTPNYVQGHTESNPKFSGSYFTSNETLLQCQGPLWVDLYLFNSYSGIRAIWENWVQIPQIMCRDTIKVMQSFLHHILHWMRSYTSAEAIWGLSFTCFGVLWVLGQFGKTGPQCPNISKIVKLYYLDIWRFK